MTVCQLLFNNIIYIYKLGETKMHDIDFFYFNKLLFI